MDQRRAAHAMGVVVCTLLLLWVPAFGTDAVLAARWNEMGNSPIRGAFGASFAAFAVVQLLGLAFGVSRAGRAVLALTAAGLLTFWTAVFLESVHMGPGSLVAAPGTAFRAITVGVGLLGCAAFLGLAEWARRGAGVAGPLLMWAAVLLSHLPTELWGLLRLVIVGEFTLVGAALTVGFALGPVVLGAGLVGWWGIGDRRLEGAPLGPPDVALLLVMLLSVKPGLHLVLNGLQTVLGLVDPWWAPGLAWLSAPLLAAYVSGRRPRVAS